MNANPCVFFFSQEAANQGLSGRNSAESISDLWIRFANSIAASGLFVSAPNAVIVLREKPSPRLAILGYFDCATRNILRRFEEERRALESISQIFSYAQIETECERLAQALIAALGREEIARRRFVAIPRGGLIVLGILSYVLDLAPEQLHPCPGAGAPLVVVDDCALSGCRFGHFLERLTNPDIVFAHLHSHPDLRRAIANREPRVTACVAASDLRDCAPEWLGAGYRAWKERWRERACAEGRYWIGMPAHICYPWSEPDIGAWNPETQTLQLHWRVAPPAQCLKNRLAAAQHADRIQVQQEAKGPLRPADDVLFGQLDEQVLIANLATSECFALDGVAADIWWALVEFGAPEEIVRALLRRYEADAGQIRRDVERFLDDLASRGFLESASCRS